MPSVLVVDDALADRALAAALAAKWEGCHVLTAVDGNDALEKIQEERPDIVLTDIQMPELSGLELVGAVKDEFPGIPVILMTAEGSEDLAAQALRCGAASYVPKRRLAEDLVNTLKLVYMTCIGERNRSQLMHYMIETDTTFVLHNDLAVLHSTVDQLLSMLRCLPLADKTERTRVGIALTETLTNAYFHGNLELKISPEESQDSVEQRAAARRLESPYAERKIRVRVQISRQRAIFTVRDDGPGFDTESIAPTELNASSSGRRGLTMMCSIMDKVEFNSRGNEVQLTKLAHVPDESD